MIDKIDILMEVWGDWQENYDRKAWHNNGEMEVSTSISGPSCPECIMHPRVAKFDRIYKEMKKEWKRIIDKKYKKREKLERKEYNILDNIHHFTDGRMSV